METFDNLKEAREWGKHLDKYDHEVVMVANQRVLLCGTPLAMEDLVYNFCNDFLTTYLGPNEPYKEDNASDLRTAFLEDFERITGVDIVFVSETF